MLEKDIPHQKIYHELRFFLQRRGLKPNEKTKCPLRKSRFPVLWTCEWFLQVDDRWMDKWIDGWRDR